MNHLVGSTGITLITFLAMVCGIFVHILKQLRAARKNNVQLTISAYIMDHGAESVLCAICGFVFYLALPELAALAPEIAKLVGLEEKQTVLSSFVAGYMGNSLADFLGGRVASLAGTQTKEG